MATQARRLPIRRRYVGCSFDLAADPRGRLVKTLIDLFRLSSDPDWRLAEEGPPGPRENAIESVFTSANGLLGSRDSLAEGGALSRPATYVAGLFTQDAESGIRTLVSLPDWSHVDVFIDGRRLSLDEGRVLEHRRVFDLARGLVWREWEHEDTKGEITRLLFLRFASLADRHILAQSVIVRAENHASTIAIAARAANSIDGVAIATTFRPRPSSAATGPCDHRDECRWEWQAARGEPVRLDRLVSVHAARERAGPQPASTPAGIERSAGEDLDSALQAHIYAWRTRWNVADIRVDGDAAAQRALRFAVFRLLSAANPDDEYASIGARGLTGPAYHGHVFWDTEIYMLPFYLFADPPSARALLSYRYHTLDGARRKAEAHGCKGALYAWESADTGDETTPRAVTDPAGKVIPVLTGQLEQHISADVAYAVWQYWQATGDDEFMLAMGAEILVETARFWASRARVEADGAAHIRKVIGPDEYHGPVDDNAYTNAMARWNLRRAALTADMLERARNPDWPRLRRRLSFADGEPAEWRRIGDLLVTGYHPESNLLEQFAGFFQLDEIDVSPHRGTPIDVRLGYDRIQRVQAIKQPDVVALSALLWDEWPLSIHEANFRYYEPRTAHGSSLSPSLSALVAARLGHGAQALDLFRQGAAIDLADRFGRANGGVHMGAQGGLWQAAVFGMAGVRVRSDGVGFDPRLPPGWTALHCHAKWRGRTLAIRINAEPLEVEVDVLEGGELTLSIVDGPACRAHAGARRRIRREHGNWGVWRDVQ